MSLITRPVLWTAHRRKRHVAWGLIEAIEKQLPKKWAELASSKVTLERIRAWTKRYDIDCEAVEFALRVKLKVPYLVDIGEGQTIEVEAMLDYPTMPGEMIFARPEDETRGAFIERAGKHWDKTKKLLAKGDPWTTTEPIKNKKGLQHFEWLARKRVGGETLEQIAKRADKNRNHVEEKTNETAKLIGLTVRRGRPRKKP